MFFSKKSVSESQDTVSVAHFYKITHPLATGGYNHIIMENNENVQTDAQPSVAQQTIIIQQQPAPQSNGVGTAGFILAILGLVFCWVPVLGWLLWLIGLILSFVGVFKKPRGLSVAGLCISCIDLIILIILVIVAGAALGAAAATM